MSDQPLIVGNADKLTAQQKAAIAAKLAQSADTPIVLQDESHRIRRPIKIPTRRLLRHVGLSPYHR